MSFYDNNKKKSESPLEVKISESETTKANGLFTVESDLYIKAQRTDKDALFYCEVKYLVPGGVRMTESKKINIIVHCESTSFKPTFTFRVVQTCMTFFCGLIDF